MTPSGFYNPFGYQSFASLIFAIDPNGFIDDYSTDNTLGLRPVINLKSTLKFTGDGTKNNPYIPSL